MNKIEKAPEDLKQCASLSRKPENKKLCKVTERFRVAIICFSALVLISIIICVGYYRSNALAVSKALNGGLVCIDPGHGFDDPGTVSELLGDVTEAKINMSISQMLADELKKCGFSVIFTHDGITLPQNADVDGNGIFDPTERVTYSDGLDTKPDIFISIHCDSFPSDASVNGTRLYYQGGTDRNILSGLLGSVSREIDGMDDARRDTLVKSMSQDDAYTVICDRKECLAFLIECGFVTNADDAQRLTSADWQHELAKAIAQGIYRYCNK